MSKVYQNIIINNVNNVKNTFLQAGRDIYKVGGNFSKNLYGPTSLILALLIGEGIINKINVQPPVTIVAPSTPVPAPTPEPVPAPTPEPVPMPVPAPTPEPVPMPEPENRSIKVRNTSTQIGNSEWWDWTVYVESDSETLSEIDCVQYTLHHTFINPINLVCTSENNFALSTRSWGTFYINVKVLLKDGTVRKLSPYLLKFR